MGLLLKWALKGLQMVFIVVCSLIIYIIYALKCSARSLMALYEVFLVGGMKIYVRILNGL